MKVFLTKHALTKGIIEEEVNQITPDTVEGWSVTGWIYHKGEGREWHRTKESAAARAESMREAALRSLERKKLMLQQLKFTIS